MNTQSSALHQPTNDTYLSNSLGLPVRTGTGPGRTRREAAPAGLEAGTTVARTTPQSVDPSTMDYDRLYLAGVDKDFERVFAAGWHSFEGNGIWSTAPS